MDIDIAALLAETGVDSASVDGRQVDSATAAQWLRDNGYGADDTRSEN